MMKKIIAIMTAALLMLMPALCLAQGDDDHGKIEVSGYASMSVVPDLAEVTFGVEMTDKDAAQAQSRVNEVISAATEALAALDIPAEKIRTSSLSLYREYDYSGDSPVVIGFTASTSLTVSLDDISLTGPVIDAGLSAGANTLSGVSFASSRQAEYYDQALAAAMTNAQHKAEVLAQAAGCELAGLCSVSESYSNSMYVTYAEAAYDKVSASGYNAPTQVSAGEVEITANVSAVFDVK